MKRVLVSGLLLLFGAAQASAEVLLVCQTPRFWCDYAWDSFVRGGQPCACYSPQGPVPGRTIVPATYGGGGSPAPSHPPVPGPSAGESPAAQSPTDNNPALAPKHDSSPPGAGSDRCLNGLGDCPGA